MNKNFRTVLVSAAALILLSIAASAQSYHVGDIVEAHSFMFYPDWQKAEIKNIGGPCGNPDKPYYIHWVDKEAGLDTCVGASDLRNSQPKAQSTAVNPTPGTKQPREGASRADGANKEVNAGDTVEVRPFPYRDEWEKAEIKSVGAKECGNPDKPYLIHFVGRVTGFDRCFGAADIRTAAAGAEADDASKKELEEKIRRLPPLPRSDEVLSGEYVFSTYQTFIRYVFTRDGVIARGSAVSGKAGSVSYAAGNRDTGKYSIKGPTLYIQWGDATQEQHKYSSATLGAAVIFIDGERYTKQ